MKTKLSVKEMQARLLLMAQKARDKAKIPATAQEALAIFKSQG